MGMNWDITSDLPACQFRVFGCPKCGAKHKYGHKRPAVTCYRCGHYFSPTKNSRKFEEDRLINLTPEEREKALENINSVPPWTKARKAKREAIAEKKRIAEQQRLANRTRWEKFKDYVKELF